MFFLEQLADYDLFHTAGSFLRLPRDSEPALAEFLYKTVFPMLSNFSSRG